ncbi:MAG: imidazolonepropionase, partial [Flavobacteriaceae bacterium]|nr:imidazolonepropionase [Flavobacteriaceae bacterium]
MTTLITNIQELIQVRESNILKVSGQDMKRLPTIKNAYLLIDDDTIVGYGPMDDCNNMEADTVINAFGKLVL